MPARSARPKLPPDLARPLARIRRDLGRIDDYLSTQPLDFDQAATLYRELDRPLATDQSAGVTQLGAMVRDNARGVARKLMPAGDQIIPEVGTLTRCMTGAGVTWDGFSLVGALAARVADEAVDPETGEIKPPAVIAEEAAMVVADCAGLGNASASFKSTAVEGYGLVADRYRTRHGGTPSVRFT